MSDCSSANGPRWVAARFVPHLAGMLLAAATLVSLASADVVVAEPEAASYTAPQEAASLGTPSQAISSASEPPEDADADSASGSAELFSPRAADLMQVGGALAAVLALLFLTRYFIGKATGGSGHARPSGVVEILARYPVARGQQLILLKLARRVLLIHQNGSSMTTLSELVDEHEVASLLGRVEAGTAKKAAGFKAIFSKFSSEHDVASGSAAASADQGEIIDLTRRPGALGKLFTSKGVAR